MAKKKKFEKVTSFTYADEYGNIKTHKMTGDTGGYHARDLGQEAPAMAQVSSQTIRPLDTVKDVRTLTLDDASKNLKIADNELKVADDRYQNALSRELKKTGEDYRTKFDDTRNKKISYQTKEEDELPTKPKVIPIQEANKNLQNELNERQQAYDRWKIANYENNLAKVNSEESTLFDKTLGVPIRAIKDLFSPLSEGSSNQIIDEEGNKTYLPSYNELKQQKVRQDTKGLAGVAQDIGYNATKVLGATALDAVTGGIGGKSLYWTDMAADNYKNVKNQGYSNEQAIANTIVSTGSEFLTEKLLGGLTKEISPGQISQLDDALTKSVSKFVANPKVASVIGSMGSEGVEEFTQEWIGALNNKITLGEDKDLGELVQDSLYSALVGAGSGGLVRATSPNVSIAEQTLQSNQTQAVKQQNLAQTVKTQPTSTNIQTEQNAPQTAKNVQITEPQANQQETTKTRNKQMQLDLGKQSTQPTSQIQTQEFKDAQQKVKNGTATEKERSYIKTATEAQNTQEMTQQMEDTAKNYEVLANEKTLKQAEAKLKNIETLEDKAKYVSDILNSDKRLNASDMAAAELVLKDAAAAKNTKLYNQVLADLSVYATEQGQSIQALSMIKKLSPTSQLDVLEKIINREKATGNKAYSNVEVTEDMKNRIFDCYDENGKINQEKFDETMENIKQELADEINVSAGDKVRAWRYLSMLGNPKTHVRNVVANVAMNEVKTVKDKLSGATQDIFIRNKANKTATLKNASKDVKSYTNTVYDEVAKDTFGNKYNEKSDLEDRAKVFKTRWLEAARKFNDKKLSQEDQYFKKINFKRSFSNYLTAQGISTEQDIKNNPQIVEKAKLFAMEEANVATFNQQNKLAQFINSGDKKLGTPYKVIRGAIIPFTRTPLNIAKTGIEYTPGAGMITLANDVKNAPSNMKGTVFIDGLSKQVTGSALALIGYALAKSGRVTAKEDDDKEGYFKQDQGTSMDYSIKFGDTSYDLSWLSPSSMPFFVGARMFEVLDKQEGFNENIILESLASTADPLSEMSCISSFTKILNNYSKEGAGTLKDIGVTTAQNYLSQFVPTISGQVARLFDDTKRTTSADKNSPNKITQETYRTLAYKIPGLRNTLPESTDYLGREKKEYNLGLVSKTTKKENLADKFYNSFLSPVNKRKDTMTKEGKEILRIAKKTGNDDIIPSAISRTQSIKYNDKEYTMSRKEYNEYKKVFGKDFDKNMKELMDTNEYENATNEEKAQMIKGIMDYSKDKTKDRFLTKKGEDYSSTSDEIDDFIKDKMGISDYYALKVGSTVKLGEGKTSIVNGKNALKNIALVDAFNIDAKDYLTYSYKIGQIKADKNSNGKTINGSAKRKKIEYIQSLPLSATQKQMLYSLKVDQSKKKKTNDNVIQIIQNSDLTAEEKKELYNYIYG